MAAITKRATLTIANAATVSDAFRSADCVAFGLQMPGTFTGTSISFQVSADRGTTFQALYDSTGSTLVSVSVAASRSYDLPAELTAFDSFKIVSGSSEGGARSLVVIGKAP